MISKGALPAKLDSLNFGALFVGKRWHRFSVNQRGFPKATDGCQLTTAVLEATSRGRNWDASLHNVHSWKSELQLQFLLFSCCLTTNFLLQISWIRLTAYPARLGDQKNHMSVHALEARRGSDSGGFSKVIGSVSDLHFVLFGDLQKTEAEENYLCCMGSNLFCGRKLL